MLGVKPLEEQPLNCWATSPAPTFLYTRKRQFGLLRTSSIYFTLLQSLENFVCVFLFLLLPLLLPLLFLFSSSFPSCPLLLLLIVLLLFEQGFTM